VPAQSGFGEAIPTAYPDSLETAFATDVWPSIFSNSLFAFWLRDSVVRDSEVSRQAEIVLSRGLKKRETIRQAQGRVWSTRRDEGHEWMRAAGL
jgi:hypothetical protein